MGRDGTAGSGAAGERLLFLCGADMAPSVIRARYPAARFVDIARCADPLPSRAGLAGLSKLHALAEGGLWGIVVRAAVPAAPAGAPEVAVTFPDGTRATALLATQPGDLADVAAVAAAVRYWELPPSYRMRVIAHAEQQGAG